MYDNYTRKSLWCTYGRADLGVGRAPALAVSVAHVVIRAKVEIVAPIAGLPRPDDAAVARGRVALIEDTRVGVGAELAVSQTEGRADASLAKVAKAAPVPIVAGGSIPRDAAVGGLQYNTHTNTDQSQPKTRL
jgi:hypothetical protein